MKYNQTSKKEQAIRSILTTKGFGIFGIAALRTSLEVYPHPSKHSDLKESMLLDCTLQPTSNNARKVVIECNYALEQATVS